MKGFIKQKILYIGAIPFELGGKAAGGIETHCWQLATEACKNGYKVYILTYGASSFEREKDGVRIISISQNKFTFPLKVFYALKNWAFIDKNNINHFRFLGLKDKLIVFYCAYILEKIINYIKPDIIHIHSLLNMNILGLSILKISSPIVVTDHGIGVVCNYGTFEKFNLNDKDYLLKKISLGIKIANYVISVSNFAKNYLKKFLDFSDEKKITAILNPLDINKLSVLNKEELRHELRLENKKVVFFSGVHNSIKKKGLDILLRAFDKNEYLRKTCSLLVVADKSGLNFAQNFVKNKNIDIMLFGPQQWQNVVKFYNVADVFVLPSRTEGIGIVYEESLAIGTPIVGFSESISEIEELLGIYVGEKFDANQEDERNLAEKVIKVLNTDFDRKNVRKKAVEKLSWESKFCEFERIYKELR
ncbi:hypothetical protein AC481_06965 [miscellaneous Crenarchaeota group archaeon SMTZ-80]|nr:MAG: hypothetical protein AC481_06965 [miscellaneous Crenarchaeota group archaeon SMTZ-80]